VSYGTDKLSLNLVLLGVNRISMQSSCGATKADAVDIFHSAVVSSDGENMIHASAILDKLK
jgi:hypothetical protein